MKGLFITGTDTDCGKTRVALALIRALRADGVRVAPFKPVAAGALQTADGLRNDDALQLIAAAGGRWRYEQVNPYCLEPAVSPHLAARDGGIEIEPAAIRSAFEMLAGASDCVVAEGAGGWLAPLAPDWSIQDLALMLGLPVVLVVGLRLGCLNHACLSAARIIASGAALAGWVGSVVDPDMPRLDENIQSLRGLLNVPCLGVLPRLQPGDSGWTHLDREHLREVLCLPGSG